MKRHIQITGDGSSTLRLDQWDEPYHSIHGAIQESMHVFIEMGLRYHQAQRLRILEVGFGTGLNALLTLLESGAGNTEVFYTAVEAFPLTLEEALPLNYPERLGVPCRGNFENLHRAPWEQDVPITPTFSLKKKKADFMAISEKEAFDLVYFDAFSPRVQPELWTENLFAKMFAALDSGGILVTYSAKGSVRRALQAVGFKVERLPGPPGKREMLRAIK